MAFPPTSSPSSQRPPHVESLHAFNMCGTNPQYAPLLSGSDTFSSFEAKSKCNLKCMKVVIDALDENGAESMRGLVLKFQPQAGWM